MTLNNNRALLLWYFKLCASFHNNQWIETWVTDHKRPIWVKIRYCLPRMNLKLDRSTWTLGHFIYATSSSEHHFITNQTRVTVGTQIWVKISYLFFFTLHDLEIWWLTLKNNRAPLLCYFKLCASFYNHWWIQTQDTVEHLIWVKNQLFFCAEWPWTRQIWGIW